MHTLFTWTQQGLITTAWNRRMFVDANDHERQVGSLLQLRWEKHESVVGILSKVYNDHQTAKRNVFINCLTQFQNDGELR